MWSLRKGTVVGSAEDLVVTNPLLPCGLHDRSCFQSTGMVGSGSDVFTFDRNRRTDLESLWAKVSGGRIRIYPRLAHLGAEHPTTSPPAFYCDRRCPGPDQRWLSLASCQTQLSVQRGRFFKRFPPSVLCRCP